MSEKRVESVYELLGYAEPESMLIKADLVSQISQIIEARGMTQAAAAEAIGMPQPKLSNLLRGQFRGVSEAKMMECLAALGRNVEIVITDAPKGRAGRVTVVPRLRAARGRAADAAKAS